MAGTLRFARVATRCYPLAIRSKAAAHKAHCSAPAPRTAFASCQQTASARASPVAWRSTALAPAALCLLPARFCAKAVQRISLLALPQARGTAPAAAFWRGTASLRSDRIGARCFSACLLACFCAKAATATARSMALNSTGARCFCLLAGPLLRQCNSAHCSFCALRLLSCCGSGGLKR